MRKDPWENGLWQYFALEAMLAFLIVFRQKLALLILGRQRFERAKNRFFSMISRKLNLGWGSPVAGENYFGGRYYRLSHKSGLEISLYCPSLPLFGSEAIKVPILVRYARRRQRRVAIKFARELSRQLRIPVQLKLETIQPTKRRRAYAKNRNHDRIG